MKKINVLFVCLGNICRSPMAEFILKDIVRKHNLEDRFHIESAATSYEEEGNDIYYLAKEKLIEKNINFTKRRARRIEKEDYDKYDFIIGMEESNIRNIKRIIGDKDSKIYKLLDFTNDNKDIDDPWYTGRFEEVFNQIKFGCEKFIDSVYNYDYIGTNVKATIDRKKGDPHPKYPQSIYPINYGYVPGVISGDGKDLDVYVLGEERPLEEVEGKCIAIIHRVNDNDDKLVISANGEDFTIDEIKNQTNFIEQYFKSIVIK